jgi:tryptophan 2,3-dioxygenase
MTPLDFLDFRDMLRPASGFQSMQFKILEARLGLRMPNRHGREYYISQLKPEDAQRILDLEHEKTLLNLVNEWLERMPFFDQSDYWQGWESRDGLTPFWAAYTDRYRDSLGKGEMANFARYEELFFTPETKSEWALSPRARRAALFIMLYRDYPLLQLPFNLINALLEIDEGLATWRYRHLNMVQRIIGARMGTGGSSGAGYLRGAMERHYVFGEFAELTSFLIERTKLPKLTPALCDRLGFR